MSSKQAKSNTERRQFWQMAIETWKNSGLSVSQFCKAEGLSEGTFYGWRRRLSARNAQRKHKTLNLEEYRCKKCGRVFYIDAMDRHPLNMDFGCPHGCDDGSERMRDIVAEIKEVVDGRVSDFSRIKDHNVVLSLSEEEFERSMGRAPEDQNEFDAWAAQTEDVLCDSIDWNVVCECAHEAIQDAGERE